jgi:hypothetical protein
MGKLTIVENGGTKRIVSKELLFNERGFDPYKDLPKGIFFWETASKIKQTIRKIMLDF